MGKNTQEKINPSKAPLIREFSAGGAAYIVENGETRWYLINPVGTSRWQLPKGHLDGKETSSQAAIREVAEEVGVETEIVEKLGVNSYFHFLKGNKIFKTVTFFLMKVVGKTGNGHDGEVAEVKCVPGKEALELLTYKDEKEILVKAIAKLKPQE